ncbi:unnamed protein product [Owenia fusiformis]|uniref:Uncharacterized protein n=1 Tax=Owenia fusiformis TaxID=6347 RepID=A0A8J1UMB8_OWEFU|nr:unnamed protein product [Owenia fusiformis]
MNNERACMSYLNLRKQFKKWRWIIAGFYGTMLFIMFIVEDPFGPKANVLQQQNANPVVVKQMDSGEKIREAGNRTQDAYDNILEKYKNYIRTHNITVTMFTTFADREESRYVIQNNTLLNWLHLQNVNFKLVLFGNERAIAEYHLQHIESFKKRLHLRETPDSSRENADLYKGNVPDVEPNKVKEFGKFLDPRLDERIHNTSFPTSNELYKSKSYSKNDLYYQTWDFIKLGDNLTAQGRPILKQMYLEVQRRYHSDLYMYVNGDILFHAESLLQTLYGIKQFVDDPKTKRKKWLLFGGRREVNFFDTKTRLNHVLQFGDDSEIQSISLRSRVINHNALDFFICSRTSFPWIVVPDFVVSLPLFDHWLVLYSNKMGIETFDISGTALVVHQRGVTKLKDSKYAQADNLNTFLFDSSVGIRCAFDTFQARLECMRQRTRRQRVLKEDVIVIAKNNNFNKYMDMGCVYEHPFMVPVIGKDPWNNL